LQKAAKPVNPIHSSFPKKSKKRNAEGRIFRPHAMPKSNACENLRALAGTGLAIQRTDQAMRPQLKKNYDD